MDDRMEAVVPWLTLKSVRGVGNLLFRRLITHFGSPRRVLNSSLEELARVEGITAAIARTIQKARPPGWIDDELSQACKAGFTLLTQNDARYPNLLLQIPDPPPVLYVNGRPPSHHNTVAVVGARKATAYGRRATFDLCKELARSGITVVSGMALGIDTAAHQGALAGGGSTVAILGSGLGNIYPTQNLKLSRLITETGSVISEFPIAAPPEAHHFPKRNRIISGMSLGTVVVEAARRSGSLITARLAAEQNREVFAVPGSIHAQTTQGTHDLIKQGAKLVDKVADILIEIFPQLVDGTGPAPSPDTVTLSTAALTPEEAKVFSLLGPYPVHIDTLARRHNLPIHHLTSMLSQLELKGVVCQEPGKYFLRLPQAKIE